jgi:hypothetical protein
MTRLEAMAQTSKRFTNLMDGSVLPSASVLAIINYYEFLIDSNPVEIKYQSGIEANFAEAEIEDQLSEADYWDGDESDKFLY